MTAFHEAIVATDPLVFIPFDGPDDTTTTSFNLGSLGSRFTRASQSVSAASAGSVAFDSEAVLDGVDDFWFADSSPLVVDLRTAISAAEEGSTWAVWWRTTATTASNKYILSLDPGGMAIYKNGSTISVEFTDEASVVHTVSSASPLGVEVAGGWQLTGMQVDPAEGTLFIYRNGFRTNSGGGTIVEGESSSMIRSGSSTTLYAGRDSTLGASSSFAGSIGPIMIWDRALSGDEFLDIYLAGLSVQATRTVHLKRPAGSRMQPRILLQDQL